MQKIIAYVSGAFALLVVAASIVSALVYAVANGMATLTNLANSTLSGIGISIGSCLGAALVLRWKAARRFVSHTIQDIHYNHPPVERVRWWDGSAKANGKKDDE